MSKNALGWFKIIGSGAAAALGVLAVPFTGGASIGGAAIAIAALTGLTAAGTTASALYQEAPPTKPPTP